MGESGRGSSVRLAELVATLSLGTDLGLGQPMEHVLRQCLIALRLSERLGFDEAQRRVVYYSGLLAWVGCFTDAYEQAKWFGDDIALKADGFDPDSKGLGYLLGHIGMGKSWTERIRLGVTFLGDGRRAILSMLENHYLAADALAARLGLGDEVRESLKQTFERWDGKQTPLGLKGEEILLPSRLIHLANVVEVFHRQHGVEAAVRAASERSGSEFDPGMVEVFCEQAPHLLVGLDAATSWDVVLAAEPSLRTVISDEQFEGALEAIADFVDLKSPYTIGHSRGVADLAAGAARDLGLPHGEVVAVRRAGLVHDFGRLGVSNAIWDKRGPLTRAEFERVRLHPYLSERMLAFSPILAPLGVIAVQHHERLDGSGYPRGFSGDAIGLAGRLLGAADTYHAMTEARPHRPARPPEEAAAAVRAEVAAGRLDGDAVDAVSRTAGHRVKRRREWPADLTTREVEVLRLVTRGYSNREIAEQLTITRKTAGNHVQHIYEKIGATNRARAALFAMKHGLMSANGLAQFKQMARATWAAGDFPAIAKNDLWAMGDRIVRRVGVCPGEDVLDVACGTGNAAIRAAAAGGRVVGLDLTPELFEAGRCEAAASGVEIEWVEGDAEELPFDDERFDVVLSTFGCMFAPRHDVTAREMARVLRRGGRMALFNWTPDGAVGRAMKATAPYVPPAPAFAAPPLLWGTEEHVRHLFASTGIELAFDRELAPDFTSRFATVDERIEYYTTAFGPLIQLRQMTEAQGTWPALRNDLAAIYSGMDEESEYLVVLGHKR